MSNLEKGYSLIPSFTQQLVIEHALLGGRGSYSYIIRVQTLALPSPSSVAFSKGLTALCLSCSTHKIVIMKAHKLKEMSRLNGHKELGQHVAHNKHLTRAQPARRKNCALASFIILSRHLGSLPRETQLVFGA